jgi:hypothetical protein
MANVAVNHRRQARRRCRTKGAQKIVRITNPSQLFSSEKPIRGSCVTSIGKEFVSLGC